MILATLTYLLFSRFQLINAICDTFVDRCYVDKGNQLPFPEQEKFVTLKDDKYYFFSFKFPSKRTAAIDISVLFGSIEIYAALNRKPTPTDYDYYSVEAGEKDFLDIATDHDLVETDRIHACIHATDGTALFRGVVSSPGDQISIDPGFPQLMRIPQQKDVSVKFQVPGFGDKVDVIMTAHAFHEIPMTLHRPLGSDLDDTDTPGIISFTPDRAEVNRNFLLDISPVNRTLAAVAVRVNKGNHPIPLSLLNGVSNLDHIDENEENYYLFQVPARVDKEMIFQVYVMQGSVDLFVNTPEKGFYHKFKAGPPDPAATWSSPSQSEHQYISILPLNRDYVSSTDQNSAYYITVSGNAQSRYVIVAQDTSAVTTLMEGVDIWRYVSESQYLYFRYFDDHPEKRVDFDLRPSGGDADLFISCNVLPNGQDSGYPSRLPKHHNFSSAMYMEDLITITPDDPHSCSHIPGSTKNMFYIAVFGYSEAVFTLSAMHQQGVHSLSDGVPSEGYVYSDEYQSYRIRVGYESQDLNILIATYFGDVDLYVRLNEPVEDGIYDYRSNDQGPGMDRVFIPETKICVNCWVYMRVYAYATAKFSVIASFSDHVVRLRNGVPQWGSVDTTDIQYYAYEAVRNCSVTAVVTLAGGGAVPALFMSKDVLRPNGTSKHTLIRDSDSGFGTVPELTVRKVQALDIVVVGVAGAGANVTYTIRMHDIPDDLTKPPSLLTLLNGIPQNDDIRYLQYPQQNTPSIYSDWLFYSIPAPIGHEDIEIRAVASVGNVDLFVRHCDSHSAIRCATTSLPNATEFLVSTQYLDTDKLTIIRQDTVDSLYLVGVHSTSYYSSYQISATLEHSLLRLQAGVSVMDHVGTDEIDYFSFVLTQPQEGIRISLTTISGDPDLYVSTTIKYPSPDNYTWESYKFGSDVLEINPRLDSDACTSCTYYIAVVGSIESTYSLTVSLESTVPQLRDGVPLSDSVTLMGWKYYSYFDHFGGKKNLDIILSTTFGNADLYVKLGVGNPSWADHDYSSTHFMQADEVNILATDQKFINCFNATSADPFVPSGGCQITVGVFGLLPSEYVITLTSSSAATLLQLGVPTQGSVARELSSYYKVLISQRSSLTPYTLRFSVTPYSGHMSLYVSCAQSFPNASVHQWALAPALNGLHLDVESLAVADEGCLSSSPTFYASVHGDGSAGRFSISAAVVDNSSVPQLVQNTALYGTISYHQMTYYYLPLNINGGIDMEYQDLSIHLTVLQGSAQVYIGSSWEKRPYFSAGQVQSYIYSSTSTSASAGTSSSSDIRVNHDQLQDFCEGKDGRCYLIVAVFGSHGGYGTESRFSILQASKDSTIQLVNGVPQRGFADSRRYEYYKYTLVEPHTDVVIAVTAFAGDPDVYISMYPNIHPSRTNYTWAHTLVGGDTITLQYREISEFCEPNPEIINKHCDFYIGVFGWQNTTFSVTATADEGFLSPVTLLDQQPQSGHVDLGMYSYYRYVVNVDPPGPQANLPPLSIKFLVTPTDGGDVDLYLLFAPTDASENITEPGKSYYDYKSTGWSSVSEQIEISADMPHYCFDCTVYIGVYGYTGGAFSIQATSTGLVTLQAGHSTGGLIGPGSFIYYSYFNAEEFAEMKFTLTVINGDADLYINSYKPGGNPNNIIPTKTDFQWRSLNLGSDVVNIDYSDPNFCFECEYIVGVYGYHNSTYTMLVSSARAGIIKLALNRPQLDSLRRNDMQYFSVAVASDVSDTTISITPLNTGTADLYLQFYNDSTFNSIFNSFESGGTGGGRLPDPNNPATYFITTAGTQDNHLFMPGTGDGNMALIIGVKALSPIRFNIIASSSSSPVLLQASVPQNHVVRAGKSELFKFYPDADENLHVTLTARSGDPDLFVTSDFKYPYCSSGSNAWDVSCSNYTWSSRMYYTDEIVILRDAPCFPALPTTYIAPSCNPQTSYQPTRKDKPIFISVYGYKASKFSLLATPLGREVKLLPGQPQIDTTSIGYICPRRSAENGACLDSSDSWEEVQVGYFSFHVGHDPDRRRLLNGMDKHQEKRPASNYDVILTVLPSCNMTGANIDTGNSTDESSQECSPGCSCSPLMVYVNSCPISKCTPTLKKPSALPGQHQASFEVSADAGSSLFLGSAGHQLSPQSSRRALKDLRALAEGNGATDGFCDPSTEEEDCLYFVAVTSSILEERASFTITARTPGDVILIPCTSKDYPDGIKLSAIDLIGSSNDQDHDNEHNDKRHHTSQHFYELCSETDSTKPSDHHSHDGGEPSKENLIVELEQCYGRTSLFACADDNHCASVLPSLDSWGFYSDAEKTCKHSWTSRRDQCSDTPKGLASISLPQRAGNFFLMTNGTGMFQMKVQTTINTRIASPSLVFTGMHDHAASVPVVSGVTGNTVTMEWHQSQVLMPGLLKPVYADYLSYEVYIIDVNKMKKDAKKYFPADVSLDDVNKESLCGLKFLSDTLPDAVDIALVNVDPTDKKQAYMSHKFVGLNTKTEYQFVVVATCDADCLRQLSKSLMYGGTPLISCNAAATDCKPQSLVYSTSVFTTDSNPDKAEDGGDESSTSSRWTEAILSIGIIMIIGISLVLLSSGFYWYQQGAAGFSIPAVPNWFGGGNNSAGGMTEMVGSSYFTSGSGGKHGSKGLGASRLGEGVPDEMGDEEESLYRPPDLDFTTAANATASATKNMFTAAKNVFGKIGTVAANTVAPQQGSKYDQLGLYTVNENPVAAQASGAYSASVRGPGGNFSLIGEEDEDEVHL